VGRLYQSEREKDPIVVGTSAWYNWLEHYTVSSLVDRVGAFTARKSGTDLDSSYWDAYHTRQGKRHNSLIAVTSWGWLRVYLGFILDISSYSSSA
jgi:hypothetical protein